MKKRFIVAVLIFCCAAFFAVAGIYYGQKQKVKQKVKNDIQQPSPADEYGKLLKNFKGDSIKHIEGIIKLYDGANATAVKEESTFSFIKDHNLYHSQLGYLNSFSDGTTISQLDTVNKFLFISRSSDNALNSVKGKLMPFNDMFGDTAAFKVIATITEENQERTLSIKSEMIPEIKSMDITYDRETYLIRRTEINWWKDPSSIDGTKSNSTWLTKIEYRYVKNAGEDIKKMMNDIFIIKNNTVQTTARYKDYRVNIQF